MKEFSVNMNNQGIEINPINLSGLDILLTEAETECLNSLRDYKCFTNFSLILPLRFRIKSYEIFYKDMPMEHFY